MKHRDVKLIKDLHPYQIIEIDGFVTERAVAETRQILKNEKLRNGIVELNYKLARKHYSYANVTQKLSGLILDSLQCNSL